MARQVPAILKMGTRYLIFGASLLAGVVFGPRVRGQSPFTDLSAPGHGSELYYSLNVSRALGGFQLAAAGPAYRIGSEPATLLIYSPPPILPIRPLDSLNMAWYISPYYLPSVPQFSRDGGVFAYTTERFCFGGMGCFGTNSYMTTVQGVPGTFTGRGLLSRNGRYLVLNTSGVYQLTSWIDLATGQFQFLGSGDPGLGGTGRVIADNGTVVFGSYAGLSIYAAGSAVQSLGFSPNSPNEITIDSAGETVLYSYVDPSFAMGSARIYRVSERRDALFLQGNGYTHAPTISSDGKLVLFLSTVQFGTMSPPGTSQLYAMNVDGTGFRALTTGADEPLGVQQYTLSDDGQVAWYVTGDGGFVKLDLSNGGAAKQTFRAAAVDLSTTMVPGSAIQLDGANLAGEVKVLVNDVAAPLISVSSSTLVFQLPWETPAGQAVNVRVVTQAGTPLESSAQATVTPVSSAQAFVMPEMPVAFHQDWSGPVTPSNPTKAGEIVYLYATGLGPVQPAVQTGVPASPASLAMPLSCNAPLLYAGLAPGLIGYYQLNVQMPKPNTNLGYFQLACGPTLAANIPYTLP